MLAAAVIAGAQPGVLDHCAGAVEPGEVPGLGEDRGSADRVRPAIEVTSSVKPEFVRDGDHAGLGIGQPPNSVLPIGQDQTGALQRTGAMRADTVRVSQRGEHRANDPQAGSDSLPAGKFTPYRSSEPLQA